MSFFAFFYWGHCCGVRVARLRLVFFCSDRNVVMFAGRECIDEGDYGLFVFRTGPGVTTLQSPLRPVVGGWSLVQVASGVPSYAGFGPEQPRYMYPGTISQMPHMENHNTTTRSGNLCHTCVFNRFEPLTCHSSPWPWHIRAPSP